MDRFKDESVRDIFERSVKALFTFCKRVEEKILEVRERESKWIELQQSWKKYDESSHPSEIIMDVRGTSFKAPWNTLTRTFGTYLHAMACSPLSEPFPDGTICAPHAL